MNHTHQSNGGPPAHVCVGCESRDLGPLSALVTAPNGRTGYVCPKCTRRARDSTVFADSVGRCVAIGATVPETDAVFAKAGLRTPTTEPGVRAVLAELAQRFARDTGQKAPPVDVLLVALQRAAL